MKHSLPLIQAIPKFLFTNELSLQIDINAVATGQEDV